MSAEGQLVLGVDGGQSSTLALVAARDGRILGAGLAGPSNHVHEPGGMERLETALRVSIASALGAAGMQADAISHACLGMTGGVEEARRFLSQIAPQAVTQAHLDLVTAWAGAGVGQPSVVVIGGTGSVAYGRLADGREARSGGWGYIMGDEGSAYDLGRLALRAITQADDGRGRRTQLSERILAHFGLADLIELRAAIYATITRSQVAGLAKVVAEAVGAGDTVAVDLLANAGRDLAATAWAVIQRLGQAKGGMAVYTTGGVFQAGEPVLGSFRVALRAHSAAITVAPAAFSPAVGGVFLALQNAGVALEHFVLQNIRATLPSKAISKHQEREAS
jgi:N-acetylglucosamine kinase-like BadF-type ATPase